MQGFALVCLWKKSTLPLLLGICVFPCSVCLQRSEPFTNEELSLSWPSPLRCLYLAPEHSLAVAGPRQLKGNLLHIYLGITTHLLFSQQMSEGLYAKHQARPRGRADSFLWPRKEPVVLFPWQAFHGLGKWLIVQWSSIRSLVQMPAPYLGFRLTEEGGTHLSEVDG